MKEVEATFGKAAKAWWALTWRAVLLALLSAFLVGVVFGIFETVLNVDTHSGGIVAINGTAGAVVGVYVSIWVMRRLMTKGFGRFRLALVEK